MLSLPSDFSMGGLLISFLFLIDESESCRVRLSAYSHTAALLPLSIDCLLSAKDINKNI